MHHFLLFLFCISCPQIDLQKMPLGKLSKRQIQSAYSLLTEVQQVGHQCLFDHPSLYFCVSSLLDVHVNMITVMFYWPAVSLFVFDYRLCPIACLRPRYWISQIAFTLWYRMTLGWRNLLYSPTWTTFKYGHTISYVFFFFVIWLKIINMGTDKHICVNHCSG